jgi:hypothetical protein
MKMKPMEASMTSWKPRGPSANLDRRVRALITHSLPTGVNSSQQSVEWTWFLHPRRALGVVAGLSLMATFLVDVNSWPRQGVSGNAMSILAGLSNQSWNLCLGMVDLRRNSPLPILGWTNDGQLSSTNPSLGQSKTNVSSR